MGISTDIREVSKVVDQINKLSKRGRQWLVWRIMADAEHEGLSMRQPTLAETLESSGQMAAYIKQSQPNMPGTVKTSVRR